MKKIDINKVKIVPSNITSDFSVCVFGSPDKELSQWINFNGFETKTSDSWTNISIP